MEKMEQISEKPSWKQLATLAGLIMEILAKILNFKQAKYWLGHKEEFKKNVFKIFFVDEYADVREEWKKFYKTYFDWNVDFSTVIIPIMPTNGRWRLLFIPRGMRDELAFEICKKFFSECFNYWNSNGLKITKNIRNTNNKHYGIWVRYSVEPDIEFLGQPACISDPDMLGITLLERIVFEIKYFTETRGEHLDVKGTTFCSGSQDKDGNNPQVRYTKDKKFEIHCRVAGGIGMDMGIRKVVSLESQVEAV
jgi:hypothetical protein